MFQTSSEVNAVYISTWSLISVKKPKNSDKSFLLNEQLIATSNINQISKSKELISRILLN